MAISLQLAKSMLLGIAEFFRFISFNEEYRLFYVVPVKKFEPYAFQHSSIRDVATCVDLLDLVALFTKHTIPLGVENKELFKEVAAKTVAAYNSLYEREELLHFPDGNIGDIGFFLLLLTRCNEVFPDILPYRWQQTTDRLIGRLLERSRSDGSMEVFFDPGLKGFEMQSEAFYLPEALLGLIACRKMRPEAIDAVVKKAVGYCAQEAHRKHNLASDSAIFYANWQFQLLYSWLTCEKDDVAIRHLEKLVEAVMRRQLPFGEAIATVEVACYVEGLVHAERSLQYLGKVYDATWFDREISRAFLFLNDVQAAHMHDIHGGFVHSLHSHEARLDVAGHVFSALSLHLGQ